MERYTMPLKVAQGKFGMVQIVQMVIYGLLETLVSGALHSDKK